MRYIVTFFICIFAFIGVNAKINANINGLEIGSTGLYEGVKLLKSIDPDSFYYKTSSGVNASANNFPFAGINWASVITTFKDGILTEVLLNSEDNPQEQSLILFNKLLEAFQTKYNDYLVYSSSYAYKFADDYVEIFLYYDLEDNSVRLNYYFIYKPKIGEGI